MRIFISYAPSDTLPLARQLTEQLAAYGYDVWANPPAENNDRREPVISPQLEAADAIIVLLSPDVNHEPNPPHAVHDEIEYALDHPKIIIPVLAQPTAMPPGLDAMDTLDFTTNPAQGMAQLLENLGQLEHPPNHSPPKPSVDRATRPITATNAPELHPVMTIEGHKGYIYTVAFSPDGQLLATGSGLTGKNNLLGREQSENAIFLWSVADGERFGSLKGAQREVGTLTFSSDGRTLVATGRNVKLWDVYTQKLIGTLGGHDPYVRGLALASDANLVASSSATQSEIRLWAFTNRKSIGKLDNGSWVNCLAFSPDGTLLAVGSLNRTIHIYEVASRRLLMTLDNHSNRIVMPVAGVRVLAFSPDGQVLASVSDDGGVSLWDILHFRHLSHLSGFGGDVSALSFSPDGQLIACAVGNTVHICDPSHAIIGLVGHTNAVNDVAWSPTGELLATVSSDKTIQLWGL